MSAAAGPRVSDAASRARDVSFGKRRVREVAPPEQIEQPANGKKLYFLEYFFTVSSNYRPTSDLDAKRVGSSLIGSIRDMLEKTPTKVLRVVQHGVSSYSAAQVYGLPEIDEDDLILTEWYARAEVGTHKKGGRVHVHGRVKFVHTSFVRSFREVWKEQLDEWHEGSKIKGVYVNLKWVPSTGALDEYINKGVTLGGAAIPRQVIRSMQRRKLTREERQDEVEESVEVPGGKPIGDDKTL